jgi:hypothetical protein
MVCAYKKTTMGSKKYSGKHDSYKVQASEQYSAIMDDSGARTRKRYLRDHCVTIPNTLQNVCKELSVLR